MFTKIMQLSLRLLFYKHKVLLHGISSRNYTAMDRTLGRVNCLQVCRIVNDIMFA